MLELIDLKRKYGKGASDVWERICVSLIQQKYPDARTIRLNPGDGGIDCFVGELSKDAIIWQCKFFTDGIGKSQKAQIVDSFNAVKNNNYKISKWVLCLPIDLSIEENAWWEDWSRTKNEPRVEVWAGSQIRTELLKSDNAFLRREYFNEYNEANLSMEVESFEAALFSYSCRIRVFNSLALGKTAILRTLFCDVRNCRPHTYEIDKTFLGAPIGTVQIDGTLHFDPKQDKWLILKEDRKFPPNEVEDFSFSFSVSPGWQYIIRFGAKWYVPGDKELRESYCNHSYLVGEPHDYSGIPDTYDPPVSFVDAPRALDGHHWPDLPPNKLSGSDLME